MMRSCWSTSRTMTEQPDWEAASRVAVSAFLRPRASKHHWRSALAAGVAGRASALATWSVAGAGAASAGAVLAVLLFAIGALPFRLEPGIDFTPSAANERQSGR